MATGRRALAEPRHKRPKIYLVHVDGEID